MTSERDDGGPAFPGGSRGLDLRLNEKGGVTFKNPNDGLSVRDYFAAAAMTGLCVGLVGKLTVGGISEVYAYAHGACNAALIERAYALADEALLARSRSPQGGSDGE